MLLILLEAFSGMTTTISNMTLHNSLSISILLSLLEFVSENRFTIWQYALNHFSLVLTVALLSILLWVSIGVIIARYERLSRPVLGFSNILFCIPSISLFGLFITVPHLGLGRTSAVLALLLYAMMPLVRNVYRGIRSVDPALLEAGKGMGMTNFQLLWQIQLPIAWPVIFAGVRITVVMITGIATMATFIGERNLGRLIHHGLARSNDDMIIAGAVIVSLIAVGLDFVLSLVEKKVTSPGLIKLRKKV